MSVDSATVAFHSELNIEIRTHALCQPCAYTKQSLPNPNAAGGSSAKSKTEKHISITRISIIPHSNKLSLPHFYKDNIQPVLPHKVKTQYL